MDDGDKTNIALNNRESMYEVIIPNVIPIIPPLKVKIIDSVKN